MSGITRLRQAECIAAEEVPCGLCGCERKELYAVSRDFEYQTCGNEWRFVRCLECRNVYLSPRPVAAALPLIYPDNYYAYDYERQINAIAQWAKRWIDRRTFSGILAELDGPVQRYLDIGCGNGRYLRLLADMGVPREQIYGIELDERVVARLEREGFRAFSSPVEQVSGLPEGAFQLITLFSVLEHVSSPKLLLERAHDLLEPGGLIVFEVPNIDSWNAAIFRDRFWGGYHTPRHWNLFSADTIRRVAEPMGYAVRRIIRTPGHAFWPWSLHHVVRFRWGWERLGRLLHPGICLPLVALATLIDKLRAPLGGETDNMIVFLRKEADRPSRDGSPPPPPC